MTTLPPTAAAPIRLPVGKRELDTLIAKGHADTAAVRPLQCRTVAQGRFSQLNHIRDLPPQAVVENASASLSSETVAQGIPIRSLALDLTANLNATAVWGAGNLAPHAIGFESIQVVVHIDAEVPRDSRAALVRHATLWSPVANTLHNPVHLDVTLAPAFVPVD